MYFFRDSSAKQLPAFKDPCFELAMARRKEEARWGWIPFAHGCDSHLDADRLPSLLGGEPQGIGCCGAAVQHFGSCQHGFHAVLLVHVWIKVHFPS